MNKVVEILMEMKGEQARQGEELKNTRKDLTDYISASKDRRAFCEKHFEQIDRRLGTFERQAQMVRGGWKVLVGVATTAGAVGAFIMPFMGYIKKIVQKLI